MANLFNFFTKYDKDGPGVSKNQPAKKGFFVFFEQYFSKIGKIILVNLIYIVSCIPVVTYGAATAGLTYVLRAFVRREHTFVFSDYVDCIKKNWKQSSILGLIQLIALFIWGYAVYFYYTASATNNMFMLLLGICIAIGVFMLFMHFYVYIMTIMFDLKIKQIYKNAFYFCFLGFKNNIFIVLSLLALAGIFYLFLYLPVELFFVVAPITFVLLVPATIGFIIVYNAYPVVKKYMVDPQTKDMSDEADEKPEQIFRDTTDDEL